MRAMFGKTLACTLMVTTIGLATYEVAEAARRGGFGGGRAMSRGGPAMGGSFHRSMTRPQTSMNRPQGGFGDRSMDRTFGTSGAGIGERELRLPEESRQKISDHRDANQDQIDERRDRISDRQDDRTEFYDDRKEYYNDRQEWYEDSWRRGRYISAVSWSTVGCANIVYVNDIRYYDCGGVRYEQVYRGGEVTYIIVN